jgi:hypothetical protein
MCVSWQVFASQEVAGIAKASGEGTQTSGSLPLPGGAAAEARAADASAHKDPEDFMRTTSVDTILIAARRLHTQKLQGEGEGALDDERMWAFSDDEDDYA